ncbi:hypothetical protein A7D27_04280 [Pseudomonas sp. 1D4]|uniref:DUF2167 domain-containing protein n=1 Tax=Pseudomonadaceae TaxID=135621 RepID=UPI00084B35AC|nr:MULTISPECIES: DUF2167 domain-containing protein [Pseudomonas]OEC46034.1 hypothetical protein A7D27_04280 [Pseudomonas sp. 1D4]OEC61238.1 hypothetical protein A9G05_03805 [Pseudomonas sp. ENNP23]
MSIKDLILAGLLATAIPTAFAAKPAAPVEESTAQAEQVADEDVGAYEEQSMSEEEFLNSLSFKQGKVVIGDNLATLDVPEQFVYLDGKDAERVLVEAWGNPPDAEEPLGMILPKGISPLADESWAVTIEYEESGYVSDEDASDIDYNEMLQGMKDDTEEDNTWRAENGYEPVQLIGWASQPRYDANGRKLHWAKELKFGDAETHTLNYNIRVLGRKGVLVLNFIANMDQLPTIEQNLPAVLAMTEFNPGNRYADFNPELDKVAAYGLGALIAGKVAAKTGLLAILLVLLKKFFWVPIAIGGWVIARVRGKRKEAAQAAEPAQPEAAPVVQPSQPVEPAATVMDLNREEPPKS